MTIAVGYARNIPGDRGLALTPAIVAQRECLAQRPRRWTGAANAGRFQDRRRQGLGAISDWSAEFEDPIELPNGRKLLTLRDAATYITKLPKAEHVTPEWQAAIEALILVASVAEARPDRQ